MTYQLFILTNKEQASSTVNTLYRNEKYNIGASYNNDIILSEDSSIMDSHLEITIGNDDISFKAYGQLYIEDNLVEGQHIKYQEGDKVKIGSTSFVILPYGQQIENGIRNKKLRNTSNKKETQLSPWQWKPKIRYYSPIGHSLFMIAIFYSYIGYMFVNTRVDPYFMKSATYFQNIIFRTFDLAYRLYKDKFRSDDIERKPFRDDIVNIKNLIKNLLSMLNLEGYVTIAVGKRDSAITVAGIVPNKSAIIKLKKALSKHKIHYKLQTAESLEETARSVSKALDIKSLTFQYKPYRNLILYGKTKNMDDIVSFVEVLSNDLQGIKIINKVNLEVESDIDDGTEATLALKEGIVKIKSLRSDKVMPYIVMSDDSIYMEGSVLSNGFIIEKIYPSYILLSYDGVIYKQVV